MSRVLLATMPWMAPGASCLALGTLRPLLEAAGLAADTLYGSVLFPRTATHHGFLDQFGSFLFVPSLYPGTDRAALIERIIDQHFDIVMFGGLLGEDGEAACAQHGTRRQDLREMIAADMERAGACLERCLERVARPEYDVVGFSLTFETQIPATLALVRRLREVRPDVRVMLGGAACLEEQADGLLASFDGIDAVCHTEGDHVIVPLVRALRGERPLGEVPGIAWRDQEGVHHNPSPPLVTDLDALPVPRYDDYLAQLEGSEWRDVRPRLFFETSRGCWWGQKHLCTFCGLNAEGLAFRSKTPERAYAEIERLYHDFPQAEMLQATDNILELRYFQTLLPRLARMPRLPGRPLSIFYEVKSNMKAQQVALLHDAGIETVQPGIESFDDQILNVMDKGCTGLGQVQFIKWAYQEGVQPAYVIIVRSPGEQAEAYRRMLDLLPFISHLPPPSRITPMILERFSPYFERPQDFGITRKRPKPYYRDLYPDPRVDLPRLAYQFDYDHPDQVDEELAAAVREFVWQALAWSETWQPNLAFWVDRGSHVLLVDRRGPAELRERADGVAADVFRFLDSARPFSLLRRHFAGLDEGVLRALLDRWHHRRFVYRSPEDVYLAVLPLVREGPRPPVVAPAPVIRKNTLALVREDHV